MLQRYSSYNNQLIKSYTALCINIYFMSAFRMTDFVIYTVITCMYDCMDFGTPTVYFLSTIFWKK